MTIDPRIQTLGHKLYSKVADDSKILTTNGPGTDPIAKHNCWAKNDCVPT